MRAFLRTLALQLPIAVALISAPLHLATYVAFMSLKAAMLPLGLLLVAELALLLCGNPFRNLRRPSRNWMRFHLVLTAYAIAVSVAYVITADGASRVAFIDGQYVAMYKGQILRTLTEAEALQFPNLWTRVTSIWLLLGAILQATWVKFKRTD